VKIQYCASSKALAAVAAVISFSFITAPLQASTVSIEDISGNVSSVFPVSTVTTSAVNAHADGQSALSWVVRTDSPAGAQVAVYLTGLSVPSNAPALADSIKVSVTPSRGSAAVVPDGAFATGVALSALPQSASSALNLCHSTGQGDGSFIITITTSSAANGGRGTVSGNINLIANSSDSLIPAVSFPIPKPLILPKSR